MTEDWDGEARSAAARKANAEQLHAYRVTFLNQDSAVHPHAETVLADLAQFCRAQETCVVVHPTTKQIDPLATAVLEGRREVWLRITKALFLTDRQLLTLSQPIP